MLAAETPTPAATPAPSRRAGWPGIGPQLASRLAKLDLRSDADLVLHLPLRYEDETRLTPIADALPGVPAQFEGVIEHCELSPPPRRQLLARVRDGSASLTLRWLNFYPALQKQLQTGLRVRFFGEMRPGFFGDEIVHPRLRPVEPGEGLPDSLTPIYPTTAGLAQSALRKLIKRALQKRLPAEWLAADERGPLPALDQAIQLLHHPPPDVHPASLENREHPAWQRIKFEEVLVQQISLRRAYTQRRQKAAPALAALDTLSAQLRAGLPFALTGAQARTVAEIQADLSQPHPMQRLLMGDVGSGKTCVAALAMMRAAENGWQSALMAPTEILAEQHWKKLAAWFEPLGLEVAWLSGSRKKREREATLARLASGECLFAVGTHALLEDPVILPRLALAVVDEQHRFGVRQRLLLREKGSDGLQPHLLMMSATPIPRTLAMSHYADLDLSVLDELPPGRSPIVTRVLPEERRDEVIARVRDACLGGRQAYWVCPLIEESEALQLKTAQETFDTLSAALPELNIGLIHGRLKADEKTAVMAEFAAGRLHLLVATTVIEVGVDVPNASLMVIEHAERFGLAQLHQLRGRVGRGSARSACVLLYAAPLSQTGRERLKVIANHTDGFEIAREDLRIRGPGEFVGARQSGLPMLRYADLETDAHLIEPARALAEKLLRKDPARAERISARWLGGREVLLQA